MSKLRFQLFFSFLRKTNNEITIAKPQYEKMQNFEISLLTFFVAKKGTMK